MSHNATPLTRLQELGLDLNNPADRTLLTSRIDSALAASRGFKRAVRRLSGKRDRRADAAAVSAVQRRPRGALGAARQHVVRRAAAQSHPASVARPRPDGGVHLAAGAGAGQRRQSQRGRRADQQRLRSRGAEGAGRQLAAATSSSRASTTSRRVRVGKVAGRAAGRLDDRGPAPLRERRADSGARGAEQSGLAGLPEHAHEPRRRTAVVHEGSQLPLHRPAQGFRAESGRVGRSRAGTVRHVRRPSTTTTGGRRRSPRT